MEGWDGTAEGLPSELTQRRWERFGASGAKLIWGGEAVAVRMDGRANPNQLVLTEAAMGGLSNLRKILMTKHRATTGSTEDLFIGLQLTHSGRFSRPYDKGRLEPKIAYHHPLLEKRYPLAEGHKPLTDMQVEDLIGDFVRAAVRAQALGFDFVDVKHCHGYLGHEFLSAVDRPGRYGGSLENRTRFLKEIVSGIRRDAPGLEIGVRISLFDRPPYQPGPNGVGEPVAWDGAYRWAFGGDPERVDVISWEEPLAFLKICQDLGIPFICVTAGSPYYNPHLQRPAMVPPSDGYLPPEDPLVGVIRHLDAVAHVKAENPDLILIGSGYSYLQEWLPAVAQAQVGQGRTDFVGLGRMVLSYPEMPLDVFSGHTVDRRKICRTFSECTSGPRNGLISGCFPLDPFYREHPDAARLKALSKKN
jgi:2,4-dienoyl-CoA reductase-like NADH-dependent reductase (Old Yellow Enzyme family)